MLLTIAAIATIVYAVGLAVCVFSQSTSAGLFRVSDLFEFISGKSDRHEMLSTKISPRQNGRCNCFFFFNNHVLVFFHRWTGFLASAPHTHWRAHVANDAHLRDDFGFETKKNIYNVDRSDASTEKKTRFSPVVNLACYFIIMFSVAFVTAS